jgi:hypothetical protein
MHSPPFKVLVVKDCTCLTIPKSLVRTFGAVYGPTVPPPSPKRSNFDDPGLCRVCDAVFQQGMILEMIRILKKKPVQGA